jgi:hypothetical protein
MKPAATLSTLIFATCVMLLRPAAARAQTPPDFTIANPPESPAQVIHPRDTFPFVATQVVSGFGGQLSGAATFANLAPGGYRLMIEHVSIHGRTPAGQRLWGVVHPCDNLKGSPWGTTGVATTAVIEDPTSTNSIHEGIANTALYVDPGCVATVAIQRNASSGGFGAWVTLHGHYIAPHASGR